MWGGHGASCHQPAWPAVAVGGGAGVLAAVPTPASEQPPPTHPTPTPWADSSETLTRVETLLLTTQRKLWVADPKPPHAQPISLQLFHQRWDCQLKPDK